MTLGNEFAAINVALILNAIEVESLFFFLIHVKYPACIPASKSQWEIFLEKMQLWSKEAVHLSFGRV